MMRYDRLANHLSTNAKLIQNYNYSKADIESFIPWERFVVIDLISQKQKNDAAMMRDHQATAARQK